MYEFQIVFLVFLHQTYYISHFFSSIFPQNIWPFGKKMKFNISMEKEQTLITQRFSAVVFNLEVANPMGVVCHVSWGRGSF